VCVPACQNNKTRGAPLLVDCIHGCLDFVLTVALSLLSLLPQLETVSSPTILFFPIHRIIKSNHLADVLCYVVLHGRCSYNSNVAVGRRRCAAVGTATNFTPVRAGDAEPRLRITQSWFNCAVLVCCLLLLLLLRKAKMLNSPNLELSTLNGSKSGFLNRPLVREQSVRDVSLSVLYWFLI
jgi:hypothetical protein